MTEIEHSFSKYDSLGKIRQQTTTPQVELGWKTGMSLFDDMVLLVARLQFSEVGFASSIRPTCLTNAFAPQMTNAFWERLVILISASNRDLQIMETRPRCGIFNTHGNTSEDRYRFCCEWSDGTLTCIGGVFDTREEASEQYPHPPYLRRKGQVWN